MQETRKRSPVVFPSARGFTLVELIVIAVILSILFGLISRFVLFLNTAQPRISNKIGLQSEVLIGLSKVSEMVRECGEVVRPRPGETWPHCILKTATNGILVLYPAENPRPGKKGALRLMAAVEDFSGGSSEPAKELMSALASITFSVTSPNSLIVSVVAKEDKSSLTMLTEIGLMNLDEGR